MIFRSRGALHTTPDIIPSYLINSTTVPLIPILSAIKISKYVCDRLNARMATQDKQEGSFTRLY